MDNTARIWDTENGGEMAVLRGSEAFVNYAAFSPNGNLVVTASGHGEVNLWDVASGAEIGVLRGHTLDVGHDDFSPDGNRIVTASADNTARVWDSANGEEIAFLHGHTDSVIYAAFSPDGSRIVTASEDKTARLWPYFPTTQALIDYARCIVPRQLTKEQREQFLLDPDPPSDARPRAGVDCEKLRR